MITKWVDSNDNVLYTVSGDVPQQYGELFKHNGVVYAVESTAVTTAHEQLTRYNVVETI